MVFRMRCFSVASFRPLLSYDCFFAVPLDVWYDILYTESPDGATWTVPVFLSFAAHVHHRAAIGTQQSSPSLLASSSSLLRPAGAGANFPRSAATPVSVSSPLTRTPSRVALVGDTAIVTVGLQPPSSGPEHATVSPALVGPPGAASLALAAAAAGAGPAALSPSFASSHSHSVVRLAPLPSATAASAAAAAASSALGARSLSRLSLAGAGGTSLTGSRSSLVLMGGLGGTGLSSAPFSPTASSMPVPVYSGSADAPPPPPPPSASAAAPPALTIGMLDPDDDDAASVATTTRGDDTRRSGSIHGGTSGSGWSAGSNGGGGGGGGGGGARNRGGSSPGDGSETGEAAASAAAGVTFPVGALCVCMSRWEGGLIGGRWEKLPLIEVPMALNESWHGAASAALGQVCGRLCGRAFHSWVGHITPLAT